MFIGCCLKNKQQQKPPNPQNDEGTQRDTVRFVAPHDGAQSAEEKEALHCRGWVGHGGAAARTAGVLCVRGDGASCAGKEGVSSAGVTS